MKKFVYFIAAAILLMTLAPMVQAAPVVGQPAPEFEVKDIDGNTIKLSNFKGQKVVLEWTNSQCPFVVKHYGSGNMQKTQEAAIAQQVEWISINSSAVGKEGHLDAEATKKLIAENGSKASLHIIDESGALGHLYDAQTTPHMFVIDEAGVLAYAGAIDDNSSPNPEVIAQSKNYVLAALGDIAAGKPVATPTTQPYGCGVKYGQ